MRDGLLDNLRALAMMHIVCVVHVMCWLQCGSETAKSILLFEMPAIFFIAGAAQSLSGKEKTLRHIVKSRAKRLLVPFYVFLAVLYVWMALMTLLCPHALGYSFDITSFTVGDVVRMLLTCGTVKVPLYGHTWFISTYLIVAVSLPFQLRVMRHTGRFPYLAAWTALVVTVSYVTLPYGNMDFRNLVIYNLFYVIGYACYRKTGDKLLYAVTAVTAGLTAWGFASGQMVPMQQHKFPADWQFMVFGLAWICVFAVVLRRVGVVRRWLGREWRLLRVWNVDGYYIYLYQPLSFCLVQALAWRWTGPVGASACPGVMRFVLYSLISLAVNTVFGLVIDKCREAGKKVQRSGQNQRNAEKLLRRLD